MSYQSRKFIGITGGSCSGKTTLGSNLEVTLGDRVALLSFDDMAMSGAAFRDREITDWDDPTLYRWEDFRQHLRDLRQGQDTLITARSRESKKAGLRHRLIQARPIVLVIGFLTLHDPQVRDMLDTSIYLDLPEEEIIRRRLERGEPDRPWDQEEYVRNGLLEAHRRDVVPQRALAGHTLDATQPPDRLAIEAAAIILSS